jgi:GNAT superfamily N-acetyltransferase
LPDTDAAKEWAPASAGEASMARTCATLLFTCFCSSPPHQRRGNGRLILSALQCLRARPNCKGTPYFFSYFRTGRKGANKSYNRRIFRRGETVAFRYLITIPLKTKKN